jgi:hypothetical protein
MPRKKIADTPADRLVQFFLKSVGAGCGLYVNEELVPNVEAAPLYISNKKIVEQALADGWKYDELHSFIGIQYRNKVQAALLSDILPKKEQPVGEDDNLIAESGTYFHDQLFNKTATKWAVTSEGMIPVMRGSINRKERYTLRDLMDYYYMRVKTANVTRRRSTATKTMAWVLSQASLDEVLFAIDAAAETDLDVQVVDLTRFFSKAAESVAYYQSRSE